MVCTGLEKPSNLKSVLKNPSKYKRKPKKSLKRLDCP